MKPIFRAMQARSVRRKLSGAKSPDATLALGPRGHTCARVRVHVVLLVVQGDASAGVVLFSRWRWPPALAAKACFQAGMC